MPRNTLTPVHTPGRPWYVRFLIVSTRLSWLSWHPKANRKIQSGSLINPAHAVGVPRFHWHPATPGESARSPELGRSSNPQLRSQN
jgi:hypothetical protein